MKVQKNKSTKPTDIKAKIKKHHGKESSNSSYGKKVKQSKRSNVSKKKYDEEDVDFECVSSQPVAQLGFTNSSSKSKERLEGFGDDDDLSEIETNLKVVKEKNKKKKSGGFQSMGLNSTIIKGIIKKGYKQPTPIQRKCIPLIMTGKDVVAMARTGSGKTAAFLLPMFEKLMLPRTSQSGIRAIILSPTRELALQTARFIKELGKFSDIRSEVVLGGDKMEEQFGAIHGNPDVLIVTPGRFLHVLVEMDLKLHAVEYVVFDEADRLFELGFQDQLNEILRRLPDSRQTVMFSATLPKSLVDFAKGGLTDPTLVRLDVDNKLSEQLQCAYLGCRSEEKIAVLLYLLRNIIKEDQLTVVFAATKHHVEYLNMILERAEMNCCCIYSSLDPEARRISIAKFRKKECKLLVVTDVAARGLDIPVLDNVINFNFPAKAKLFVHRVGRVARAGRMGTAYSLVAPDEVPYLIDLHLFLGESVLVASSNSPAENWNKMYGGVPQAVIDDQSEELKHWHGTSVDLTNMKRVCSNAYKQYSKSCPTPSSESVKRAKEEIRDRDISFHPVFNQDGTLDVNEEREKFLQAIKNYRPRATVFEMNCTKNTQGSTLMKQIRQQHNKIIAAHRLKLQEKPLGSSFSAPVSSELCGEDDLKDTFCNVITNKSKSNKRKAERDTENYINYKPADHHSERGLGLEKSFEQQIQGAVLDLGADDLKDLKKQDSKLKWDRRKKKFVREDDNKKVKKIKTESGAWIPASYKTNIYEQWKKRQKIDHQDDRNSSDESEQDVGRPENPRFGKQQFRGRNKGFGQKGGKKGESVRDEAGGYKGKKGRRAELKNRDQIFKARMKKQRQQNFMQHRKKKHAQSRAQKGKKRT